MMNSKPILEESEKSALYQKGMEELHNQLGSSADEYIRQLKSISEEFAWVNVAFPFGELYSRNILDLKTRELCTIAALTVQGFALPQLKLHIRAALRCGASRPEVAEVITQMTAYCGFPAATNALLIMKDVFDDESKQEE
ncbi:carboxymuconolactone decarboxylase family protein [Polynucleobacter sp. AP-RePozz3-80-G7]|uniref:carboxymuconolactone decarboxylase family protein n=1 Tax=Polynucleobacter sp. AP-RePozz3-80-G7 TaxID=2689105 RepID=UPI001C0B0D79|nr:carboxymuconolactone decarboxylase family protein [Polynucleobacter sp. AP-RePozz3-80-G7]